MKGTLSRNGAAHSPLATYVVEVAAKYGITDAAGAAILAQIPLLGIAGVRDVRVSALYEISGHLTAAQIHQIARDLLADPVTQDYRLDSSTPSPAFLLGPHWRVEVWLKPSVTDPVGESVRKAVADLRLPAPESVRTGTSYHILGKVNQQQVEKIMNKILANPVIHRTRVGQA